MKKHLPHNIKDYGKSFNEPTRGVTSSERDQLILTYTPLIKFIATRMASRLPPQVSLDDLISCGTIGLIDAINKFDPSKNVQFKTYAEFRIKGAMLDELRALDWAPRSIRRKITNLDEAYADLEKQLGRPATDEEVAKSLKMGLDEFHKLLDETKAVSFMDIELLRQRPNDVYDSDQDDFFVQDDSDPFREISLAQLRELIARCIDELPEKEKITVSLYYQEELTMKEIGVVLGYTESRISQMHSKAMYRLRSKLKKALEH